MTMTASQPAGSQTVETPASGTYLVDPQLSHVDFTTTHLFGLGKVKGSFDVASGEVVVTDPVSPSTAMAEADTTSFRTGNAMRDGKVRSKTFLDATNHPTIRFRSTSLRSEDGTWVLHGVLSVRGHESPLDLQITKSAVRGDTLEIQAVGSVDRYAHRVNATKGMVGRHLQLTITATAHRS